MAKYILIFAEKIPNLTISQIKTLVDISINIGTIGIGSVFIPLFITNESDLLQLFGLVLGLSFWYIAVRISRRII